MVCLCDEVARAPCWADGNQGGHCSVDVVIDPKARIETGRSDGPRTRDGREVPGMSVDANRVYWGMRAHARGGKGLHVRRIAALVGMEVADVVGAGDELLEHCLVVTAREDDYDVWSLLEG